MKPTPITEHPEFVAGMDERYQMEGLSVQDMAEVIIRRREYILGAKAAQSILQKEREAEWEEFFTEFIGDYERLKGSKKYWRKKGEGVTCYTFKDLLQLFRERDKDGS